LLKSSMTIALAGRAAMIKRSARHGNTRRPNNASLLLMMPREFIVTTTLPTDATGTATTRSQIPADLPYFRRKELRRRSLLGRPEDERLFGRCLASAVH
jgi:hypothetical protein